MEALGIIGLIVGIAVLILLAYRGVHMLVTGILASLVVILTSGVDIWDTLVTGANGTSFSKNMVGFIGAYFSVGASGGVIQLAQCRVTGASVIPRVRGLLCGLIKAFQKSNIPGGFQFLQKDTKRCAHNTAAHKDDIGLFSTCYH